MTSRRQRMLTQQDLKTPESSEALENRGPTSRETPPPAAGLRELIARARELRPKGLHWFDVWKAGRDSALKAIEDGADLAAVANAKPPEGTACRDCWLRGRDAALAVFME